MPDVSVAATVISTAGTLLGALAALGGVTLTNRNSVRREEIQSRRDEAQFNRQQQAERAQARQQAHLELLSTANQLKTDVRFACARHWTDMNIKLDAIQQHAVSAGLHASRVALLAPETAEAALKLASAAGRLAATTAKNTVLSGDQNQQQLGGQVTHEIDLTELDECIERFSQVAAQDSPG